MALTLFGIDGASLNVNGLIGCGNGDWLRGKNDIWHPWTIWPSIKNHVFDFVFFLNFSNPTLHNMGNPHPGTFRYISILALIKPLNAEHRVAKLTRCGWMANPYRGAQGGTPTSRAECRPPRDAREASSCGGSRTCCGPHSPACCCVPVPSCPS